MRNTRYDYSPLITRKHFELPNQCRIAVWVAVNIEHFDLGTDFPGRFPLRVQPPNVYDYADRDYGNRIGIWRLMKLLDNHNIRASVLLNSDVCEHYPIIIDEAKKRGWEFLGHGTSNSILLNGLAEAKERQIITTTLDVIKQAVGQRPMGWLSPALQESFNTPDILAEEGVKYLCDWCCDEQPFPMKVKNGTLISIPYSLDLNDIAAFLRQHLTPEEFARIIKDQFDVLFNEEDNQARIMCIALHPFLIGQPFRILWLDNAIQHIRSHENVWFATAGEIANWYYATHLGINLP